MPLALPQLIRDAIAKQTGVEPPAAPPPPRLHAYGELELYESASLRSEMGSLYPGDGITSARPLIMEEYGQGCVTGVHPPRPSCRGPRHAAHAGTPKHAPHLICAPGLHRSGLIGYRTAIAAAELTANSLLDLGHPVHDAATVRALHTSSVSPACSCGTSGPTSKGAAAQVLLDGVAVGRLDRNGPHNLTLDAKAARAAALQAAEGFAVLDVIVEAVGRSNQVPS